MRIWWMETRLLHPANAQALWGTFIWNVSGTGLTAKSRRNKKKAFHPITGRTFSVNFARAHWTWSYRALAALAISSFCWKSIALKMILIWSSSLILNAHLRLSMSSTSGLSRSVPSAEGLITRSQFQTSQYQESKQSSSSSVKIYMWMITIQSLAHSKS